MASPDAELKVRIEAELGNFVGDMRRGKNALEDFDSAAVFTNLNKGLRVAQANAELFGNQLGADVAKITAYRSAINQLVAGGYSPTSKAVTDLANKVKILDINIQKAGSGLARSAGGSNQAAFALTNLGRVAQDAPFGFIGIQNNLNPLLESFQQLRKESGSNAAALKTLVGTLVGPAGIGIALSVVTAAILFYQQYMQRANKETKETTKSIQEQREELTKNQYTKASTDLSTLTNNIKLAREGLVSKTAVLKQYNEGIGATIGKVNSLDEAEQNLVKHGAAYLKLMLLKATAEFAFKRAAEEAFEVAKKQQEVDDKNINSIFPKFKKALQEREKLIGQKIPLSGRGIAEQLIDASQISDFEKKFDDITKIANNAQQKVIDFAKSQGFNLTDIFGLDDKGKTTKDVKTIADIFKELTIDIKQANNNISGTFSDQNKEKVTAYQKAIDELIKLGVDPASKSITSLKSAAGQFNDTIGKAVITTGLKKSSDDLKATAKDIAEFYTTLEFPEVKPKIQENVLSPFQSLLSDVLPKVQSGFENFFNDILEKGKFSFASLGQAILKTFASVLASQTTTALLNLVARAANIGGSTAGGGGAAKDVTGALGSAAPLLAGGTLLSGGTLPIILGGLAAAAGIISLFKKKDRNPYLPPAGVATATASNSNAIGITGGSVVFRISGTDLIGVLNRAGQKLQRYNIV